VGKNANEQRFSNRTLCALSSLMFHWDIISWKSVEEKVKKLQMRIAKAVKERRYGKVNALQWIVTHSWYGRLLAVKRVTSNKGKRTAGVDGIRWKSSKSKMQAAKMLTRKSYAPLPLRRIYIPKSNGSRRALGIPTMYDRAMQALYALALQPVAETTADPNSYGFRIGRSCADAIGQCFTALSRKHSSRWVIEGDIKGCFDAISHQWMLQNIPLDKKILKAWLKAGYMENGVYFSTIAGTPQGGIISPLLANMVLDGLEKRCTEVFGENPNCVARRKAKVHVIRYADDFIITGNSKELLENKIMPVIKSFLKERGLSLSEEKTKITNVDSGFDFLSQHIRKFKDKLIIKPSKKAIKSVVNKTGEIIKAHRGKNAYELIERLNPVIRGWSNYHRHIFAHKTFSSVDTCIFHNIRKWARRSHNNKTLRWIREKYYTNHLGWNWWFHGSRKDSKGKKETLYLVRMAQIKTFNHPKIRGEANPFDPKYKIYFEERKMRNKTAGLTKQLD